MQNTMEKLKPYVENILTDTLVPIMFVTEKDVTTFENDPAEFIRNLYDFTETLFQPKNQVQDLLCYLVGYSSGKRKKNKQSGKSVDPKPDYLHWFLEFALKNMVEYDQKIAAGEPVDWRIKEALMFAIGTIRDNIVA